jgi:hypothetical protein
LSSGGRSAARPSSARSFAQRPLCQPITSSPRASSRRLRR